jgi:hypothetical protein
MPSAYHTSQGCSSASFPVCPPAVHAQRVLGGLPSRTASLSLPATVFSGCASTLQSLPACQTGRSRFARDSLSLARIEFRSPDSRDGVAAPGLSLRVFPPGCPSGPFDPWLPTSSVSGFGAVHNQEPVANLLSERFLPLPLPSLPLRTFIPQDPGLATGAAVANDPCARLGTCRKACRDETPDLSSLPANLWKADHRSEFATSQPAYCSAGSIGVSSVPKGTTPPRPPRFVTASPGRGFPYVPSNGR